MSRGRLWPSGAAEKAVSRQNDIWLKKPIDSKPVCGYILNS
jgi:hypothetical protein